MCDCPTCIKANYLLAATQNKRSETPADASDTTPVHVQDEIQQTPEPPSNESEEPSSGSV